MVPLAAVAIALSTSLLPAPAAPAQEPPVTAAAPGFRYQIRDLGTLGGPNSVASAVNDDGLVVGWSETAAGQLHAFVSDGQRMIDLGTLASSGEWSLAEDINSYGDVVGSSRIGGETHAVLWRDEEIVDLGTLGGSYANAVAINDRGMIVGNSTTANSDLMHGFVWQDGVMTDLGLTGTTMVYGVNDQGEVVGRSTFGGSAMTAFAWRRGSTRVDRQSSGSEATAINNDGDIVGNINISQPPTSAVMWSGSGAVSLGRLRGGDSAQALAINDDGVVLCTGNRSAHSLDSYPFLWQDGAIRDLSQNGVSGDVADLNNDNQIAARVVTANGAQHAALFSPARSGPRTR